MTADPMDDHQPTDRFEKSTRFGCGVIVGLLLGFSAAIGGALNDFPTIAVLIVSAAICGALSVRFGDRFWYALRHLRWFWL
jgi:hypothetical protein